MAQSQRYTYEIELIDSTKTLKGKVSIQLNEELRKKTDKLFLHLPSRSLEWKESFLQRQFIDFQNVRLYYADEKEKGSIKLKPGFFKLYNIERCTDCEFMELPISYPNNELIFEFEMVLPKASFNGIGYDGEVYRIIDWLPRLAPFDEEGWQLNPVTFQNDWYHNRDEISVNISLDSSFTVASNLSQINSKTVGAVREIKFYKKSTSNIQFYISKSFSTYQINDRIKLYSSIPDPYLPSILPSLEIKVNEFLASQIGDDFSKEFDLVILNNKIGEFQSDKLLSIDYPKSSFQFSSKLAHARAEQLFRYEMNPNGFKEVWLARGLPYYYKYKFIQAEYPNKKWIPLGPWQIIGRIFDLDEFDYGYQNQFLWLYISRQGLDQAMNTQADSLSRLNYEAITQAKTYLSLSHMEAYTGGRNFRRALNKFYSENRENKVTRSSDLQKAFEFFVFRDVKWFFETLVPSDKECDYQLVKVDWCPTVSTVTVKNLKKLAIPFSVTGYKEGKEVITEWFPGHLGKKSLQTYHDKFDKVIINKHQTAPEFSQKNNTIRPGQWFKRAEPVRLQFFNSFENPDKTQVYWMPSFNYNNYDKLLLSLQFHNRSVAFVRKPFEYTLVPEYSTGTNTLTGSMSSLWNFTPSGGPFHRWSTGFYARYNHYDEDLAFFRFSPSLNLFFRRNYAASKIIQRLRFRGISLQREVADLSSDVAGETTFEGYNVGTVTYTRENIHLLKPYTIIADFQQGNEFSLFSASADFRWMLPNKHWFIWRNFGGAFLRNDLADAGNSFNYYSMGLSGTQDYLFDYELIGRSDESGIWTQQFFTTDGGFKTRTNAFADRYMLASNISLPLLTPFHYKGLRPSLGLFGDIGVVDNFNKVYWDYGLRLSVFTDFLEFYFPFQNNDTNFLTEGTYSQNIRFVFNLDPSEIIERLRRGYY